MAEEAHIPHFKDNPEAARAAGAKGNETKRRAVTHPRKVTYALAEDTLTPLTCAEDVQRRIEVLSVWGSCGLLSPGTLSALVRCCDLWLKAADLSSVEKRIKELEHEIDGLERELKRRPRIA